MRDLLLPGLRIKRWIVALVLSLFIIGTACLLLFTGLWSIQNQAIIGLALLVIGILFIAMSVWKLLDRLIDIFGPDKRGKLLSILNRAGALNRGPKIVAIGGGTGLPNVLMGLKKYTRNLTAIVAMADSGGSTGRLRDEFGVLPPGDIRRSFIALSENTPMLKKLFETRFTKGTLAGHNFGNLFITALREATGSDEAALLEAGKILNIRGQALPVTLDNTHLHAKLENGKIIRGETNIDIPKHDPRLRITQVFLNPRAKAYHMAVKAIREADLIVIGPGDLYTSIVANLCVGGIAEAIRHAKGHRVYVCNLMTKEGETTGFTAAMHLREVLRYLDAPDAIDTIVVNNRIPDRRLLKKYERQHSYLVQIDSENLRSLGVEIVQANLLREPVLVRHDAEKLGKVLRALTRR
ncbi:MAG TPA: gluconeogenesis factor YvcK family protein [Candidatus Nanoarchaeia archaeon]|nr:gluconeogenesis factor YvcK family protein [Candidatus Nanoarchaeia archaeon]